MTPYDEAVGWMVAHGATIEHVLRTEDGILYQVVLPSHRSASRAVLHGAHAEIPMTDPKYREAVIWMVADIRRQIGDG